MEHQRSTTRVAPNLSADFPRHAIGMRHCGDLMPQPLLDYRLPRHQTKLHAVIEHRVTPTGKHDGTSVDASYALPIEHRSMFQAGFSSYVRRGLSQFARAQRRQ